jgi:hypothetical protein
MVFVAVVVVVDSFDERTEVEAKLDLRDTEPYLYYRRSPFDEAD